MDKDRPAESLMAAAAAAARNRGVGAGFHSHHRRSSSGDNNLSAKARGRGRGLEQNYCMSDVMRGVTGAGGPLAHARGGGSGGKALARPFPIVSFNHMSREVLDYEASRDFYCGVLGFIEIPRPAFENDGVWLYGFGLSLHLIKSKYPQKRLLLKGRRIEHFEHALPNVDHMAFITSNLNEVEKQLREHNVFYKRFNSDKMGIYQVFLFDPDGNVIEISNCAPPIGETTCMPRVKGAHSRL